MSSATQTIVDVERNPSISSLPRVLSKDDVAFPDLPTAFELGTLNSTNSQNHSSVVATPSGLQTPSSDRTNESRPVSPEYGRPAEVLQSMKRPAINRYRVLAACAMNLCNGLNDSAPGALIPYLEKEYRIGYAVVSLIFVTNAAGFLSAAPTTHFLESKFGRARTYAIAETILLLAYVMLVCRPPFGVIVLAFYFIGFGCAVNLALNNTYTANLVESTTALGLLHGAYGIGGTFGPLIATAMVTHGQPWSHFYSTTLAITGINLIFAYCAFRNLERDSATLDEMLRPTDSNPNPSDSKLVLLKQAFKNKSTVLGALFIFAYQGAEVSISGWVISFLINKYNTPAGSKIGYVTSGFWGGITLGRFVLSHPAHKVGEKISSFFLIGGAAAFQILVWLLPNIIGDAVAVSIVGLLLGPIYPCAMSLFSKLIPRRLQTSSLAAISAMGSSGGAVAPFFTGLIAQQSGTYVLHPIAISMFGGMAIALTLLPRIGKRSQ